MDYEKYKLNAEKEIAKLEKSYSKKLEVDQNLTRRLVSFQANKREPGYRWYKFKEGFSTELIKYYFNNLNIKRNAKILDPFAGSGATLFTASKLGFDSTGIELLPIGCEVINARKYALGSNRKKIIQLLDTWIINKPWIKEKGRKPFQHIRITDGAFPKQTEKLLEQYLFLADLQKEKYISDLLVFAALCILEEISYTRKDGQYLRWDSRSIRRIKSTFSKGKISEFNDAIIDKLIEIHSDLKSIDTDTSISPKEGEINLICGSILDEMPKLKSSSFDFLMTSPPYCNRYDYTRTYALELALLGVDEIKIRDLRQTMLSCTVENKDKVSLDKIFTSQVYKEANRAFSSHTALNSILSYLESVNKAGELNNPGIVRMVKNYFYELALVIFEANRVLKKGGWFVMVNDNVRYAGVTIPVDLILSDFAEYAGFHIEKISVLPRGKGNSSQQMGKYGRAEIRKCVYIWRKKS